MKRKNYSGAKLFAASVTIIFVTLILFGQPAYAEGLGDTLKQTAVKAVSYVSPTYSQKLNNTNVTQIVKGTVGGVVGKFAGPEAGKAVSNGAWRNVLTKPSAIATAGKIAVSTAVGMSASIKNQAKAGVDSGSKAASNLIQGILHKTSANSKTPGVGGALIGITVEKRIERVVSKTNSSVGENKNLSIGMQMDPKMPPFRDSQVRKYGE